jgi:2-polyprenyl-3-methyl-5-hydroxy-6-metoxy-1,4-benzoquinol methylase
LGLNIKANNTTLYWQAAPLAYEQDYFKTRKYLHKKALVERHVMAVLQWATKTLNENLLDGKGKRALDVGCAYGYTSGILRGLGYETISFDVSQHGIKQAKSHSGGEFLVCDAQTSLPFRAGAFDLVTCFDVLEHLKQPEAALLGMFDVCKGEIVCTTPNKKVEKLIRKLMHDYDETHISVKTPKEWKDILTGSFAFKGLKVASFYDLSVRSGGKLFFKSFNVPTYGLTVRIAIRK